MSLPKDFKEAWARLEWQETAVKDIAAITGDVTSWSCDDNLHLSVVPMVAQSAINKLLSLCVNEETRVLKDASNAKALQARLMGRRKSRAQLSPYLSAFQWRRWLPAPALRRWPVDHNCM